MILILIYIVYLVFLDGDIRHMLQFKFMARGMILKLIFILFIFLLWMAISLMCYNQFIFNKFFIFFFFIFFSLLEHLVKSVALI